MITPGNPVALAPDDATKLWIDASSRAVFRGLRDPPLEEIQIEILSPPRETPRHNLRFAVVNCAADQMILTVLERDHIAVRRLPKTFSTSLEKTQSCP